MKPDTLTPAELSARWGIGVKTLSQWRWNGRGPLFLKLGTCVKYRLQDIESFEENFLFENTSQYGRKV